MPKYLVATIKQCNIEAYHEMSKLLPGEWSLISDPDDLSLDHLRKLKPDYIFFPHWSHIVPEKVTNEFECVCFHMTDLPFGRGGSPLQNLIKNGCKETKLTALKMCRELDAGPVYGKISFSLEGSARNIYNKVSYLVYELIKDIIAGNCQLKPQEGDVTYFKRRTPVESEISSELSVEEIYDHIRMLDAETYPNAFCEFGKYKMLFTDAEISQGELVAKVTFLKNES